MNIQSDQNARIALTILIVLNVGTVLNVLNVLNVLSVLSVLSVPTDLKDRMTYEVEKIAIFPKNQTG